ncbi:MAG: hypothetical protein ACLTKG_00995 [Collinsella intestinalis]
MTRNLMDDYVSIMKSVGSDDASLTRIQRAVARERARSASVPAASGRTGMSARTASASAPAPCRGLRIAAVAACTALLALGGAFALPADGPAALPSPPWRGCGDSSLPPTPTAARSRRREHRHDLDGYHHELGLVESGR